MKEESRDIKATEVVEAEAPSGEERDFEEYVVRISRCSKVVKGGRKLSFSAVVVVGDHDGRVGYGLGKANEVADAIRKGGEIARRSAFRIKLQGDTIPHEVQGKFCGAKILLKPASPGTGVIAGGGARAILQLSGIRNVLSKSLGSNNKWNVVHAVVAALNELRTRDEAGILRSSLS